MKKRELVDLDCEIAILDEHSFKHPTKKGVTVVINEAILNKIADNNNRRIAQTGDACPLVIGHTKDGLPEKYQPETVGFASRFVVKPFFKTGRKAIFVRPQVYKDRLEEVSKYPRRSVELWLGKWEVDPISLLGATTPDRDLGLMRLSRPSDAVTRVFGETEMDPNQMMQMLLAQVQQLPAVQFATALMEQVQSQGDAEGGGDELPPDDMAGGDEVPLEDEAEQDVMEDDVDEGDPTEDEVEVVDEDEEEPVRHNAGGAAPSGSNTFIPGSERTRMSRKTAPQKGISEQDLLAHPAVQRLLAGYEELKEMNEAVVAKMARGEREKDLIRLQAQHDLDLDIEEELSLVAPDGGDPMPQEQYEAHLDRIVKRYRRAPTNQDVIVTATGKMVKGDPRSRAKAAAERALEKGIKFEAALKEIDGESQE